MQQHHNEGVMVSIISLAYNHEPYVREALESFVAQETDFPFEVIINDDASTDGTAAIIREYAEKYPDIIKPIFQTVNQYSTGIDMHKEILLPLARGKYFCFIETDDCIIDPKKLQKQVDFLESHPDFGICAHRTEAVDMRDGSVFYQPDISLNGEISIDDNIRNMNSIYHINSAMVRADMYRQRPECFRFRGMNDWQIRLYFALHSRVCVLPDIMTRYHYMLEGSWTRKTFHDPAAMRNYIIRERDAVQKICDYYHHPRKAAFDYLIGRESQQIDLMAEKTASDSLVNYEVHIEDDHSAESTDSGEPVMVSILCLAYNHAPYIRAALDSFVSQETSFPYEVVIHDDASTDGTADIIREYAEKYPGIIRPIYSEVNQYSRHVDMHKEILLPNARGKYFCFIESDDAIIDPKKLQKQVDFLESHPDFGLCAHRTETVDARDGSVFYQPNVPIDREIEIDEHIRSLHSFYHFNSAMMRADLYRARPACLRIPGMNDWQNVLYFALVSRVYVMPDVMTRYNFMLKDSWTIKNFNDSSVMRGHLVFEVAKIREIWAYYRFIRREAFEALMARYEEQIHKMSGSLVDYDLPEDVKE